MELRQHTSGDRLPRETLLMMFTAAMCNSCEVDEERSSAPAGGSPQYKYSYSNTDDKALVACSANMGFKLSASTPNSKQVDLRPLSCIHELIFENADH